MDRVQRSTLESFQRIKEFLTQTPLPAAIAVVAERLAELGDVITELTAQWQTQLSSVQFSRVHGKALRAARAALWNPHMLRVSRVARDVFGASGMDRAFVMPHVKCATLTLVTAAGAMANAAEPQHDLFVSHGLPADFVDQLRAARQAIVDTLGSATESKRRRVTATASVTDLLKRGRRVVRLINAALEPRLAADPELLAAWRAAKKVARGASTPVAAQEQKAA